MIFHEPIRNFSGFFHKYFCVCEKIGANSGRELKDDIMVYLLREHCITASDLELASQGPMLAFLIIDQIHNLKNCIPKERKWSSSENCSLKRGRKVEVPLLRNICKLLIREAAKKGSFFSGHVH